MTPFLNPLKNSILIKSVLLIFICLAVIVLSGWLLLFELDVSKTISLATIGLICLVVSLLAGAAIANYAIKATDFLTKAILLVTHDDKQLEAPNPETLSASKQFLSELAQSVYKLTSAQNSTKDDSQDINYYRSVANLLPIPVIILDNDQNISFANEAAIRYINLPVQEIINKPIYESMNLSFVSDLTLESWLKDSAENTVANSEVWERVRLNMPDKSRKQFDLSVRYSKDEPNGVETTLVLFDRTLQYERDDRDLTFVSLAVHELRTPLTIMRGYIEVFEDELSKSLNPEQQSFMHNMSASAQQLAAFVSNILNVARVEENALYLKLKEENWESVINGACKDMELRAKVHNKKLVLNIDKDMPTAAVDKVSIYEVLNNLIDNAIKYTHTDEDIIVKSTVKDGMIETTITDKGVGIQSNLIAHVFDKFYRAHQSKNSIGGTGLGLYLCRAIIVAHGGNIWVQSKEDQGSTFGFSVPIYETVKNQISKEDNGEIIRGAHGWIKNHSIYRG